MELGLSDQTQRSTSGNNCIKLPVYLPEAIVINSTSQTNSAAPHLPTLTAIFNVFSHRSYPNAKRKIQIFLGGDILRAYGADVLPSQNTMTLYGDDYNRLSVLFVKPENELVFKNLRTAVFSPELKATATPFTPIEKLKDSVTKGVLGELAIENTKIRRIQIPPGDNLLSPHLETTHSVLDHSQSEKRVTKNQAEQSRTSGRSLSDSSDDGSTEKINVEDLHQVHISSGKVANVSATNGGKSTPSGSIWGTWRTDIFLLNDGDTNKDDISTSKYQRASRGGRIMKVLGPSKAFQQDRSSSIARTGASYEPAVPCNSGEPRPKSQVEASDRNCASRLEAKRVISGRQINEKLKFTREYMQIVQPSWGCLRVCLDESGQGVNDFWASIIMCITDELSCSILCLLHLKYVASHGNQRITKAADLSVYFA